MNWNRMLGVGLALGLCGLAGLALAADAKDIDRLVQQLGSGKFAEREAAQKALDALGPDALPALRKAATSDDAEISRRSKELIPLLELRAETADATKPKRVNLSCKDQALPEAVQELKRLTGLPIALTGDTAALANRKVSLELKDTSVWEALDRFCVAANLAQDVVEETPQKQPQNPNQQLRGRIGDLDLIGVPQKKFSIRLQDGKPASYPTTYAGALRIRAIPAASGDKAPAKNEGEIKLEVLAEPGFSWRGAPKVRVDQAVDDKNQPVTQVAIEETPQSTEEIILRGRGQIVVQRAMIVNGNRIVQMEEVLGGGGRSDWVQRLNVKLKLPDDPGAALKQFKGMLQGRVTMPAQPLVSVDDPLTVVKSENKVVKGKGIELKLLSATKQEDGTVKISFTLDGELAGVGNFPGGVQIIQGAGGQINFNTDSTGDTQQVRLYDADGKPYRITGSNSSSRINNGVASNEFRYTFTPPTTKSEPKKLEWVGSRQATVEVPFELKDVTLTRGK